MPKKFRELLKINGRWVSIRERRRGKTSLSFEIRYRRDGYNISVSAKTEERARDRFIEKLNEIEHNEDSSVKVPTNFHAFAMYYFENFRKRKIVKSTYDSDILRYKRYIYEPLGKFSIKSITPLMCQKILDGISERGLGKTADEIFTLLNQTFKMAIKHGLISVNPMDMIFHMQHERKPGKALSIEEEKKLLSETAGSPYQKLFAIALYTGIRPYEYKTVRLEGNMIIAQNCKRKNANTGKIQWKRIPVSPMLAPYLDNAEIHFYIPECMRDRFKKILPDHTLKDMRTTFYTRCKMCGVDHEALKEFMGHSGGRLDDTYTDFPDDFLIAEMLKVRY